MRAFLISAAALIFAVAVLYFASRPEPAPSAPTPAPVALGPLAAPSPVDEQVIVEAEAPKDGVGSAFSVSSAGHWITARHVVEGCDEVAIRTDTGAYVPAATVITDKASDLALLITGRSPNPVRLDLTSPLEQGAAGFLVGYPQGEAGEVAVKLTAHARLITRGVRENEEAILAWTEVDRPKTMTGVLGGLSGGPVFDSDGEVRGVIVAESPRRGRIYTTPPDLIAAFLAEHKVPVASGRAAAYTPETYERAADTARRRLSVVQVVCEMKDE
jgi:S1-C subfamily serine protease